MIGALRGTIESITNDTILVMTGGVGYEVAVPHAGTLETGVTIQLHTYLAVRETALDLYGFTEKSDKELFELLLLVPKIGPKSALDVLRKADAALLLDCIGSEDPSRLHKMSGVGKKTCENIVNNLHEKIDHLSPSTPTENSRGTLSAIQADAIDALISLGYDPKTARAEVLTHTDKDLTVSDLVAKALQ